MIISNPNRFGRRSLLRGAGAGMLAPFLPVLHADGERAEFPRRVVFMTTPNGVHQAELLPDGTETNFEFRRVLEKLTPHKQDMLVLHGIDMASWFAKSIPNDHPPVVHQLLTANDSIDPQNGSDPATSTDWFASSISIDQLIGDRLAMNADTKTKFRTITAGVQTGKFSWKQVYRGAKDPIFPEVDPRALFDRVFAGVDDGGGGDPDPALARLVAERHSVIDAVKGDLASVMSKIGKDDKHKIDAHLERIRAIEERLDATPPGSDCSPPNLDEHQQENAYMREGEMMMDNITQAFACDLTRVATLQWANGAANQTFPSQGVTEQHHGLTHTDMGGPGTSVYEQLVGVGRWYAERFRSFVERLKSIPEGDGTMLDNTLLVWTSEHNGARKGHDRDNLPFVLAGQCGGYFRTGRFVTYQKKAHNDLYVAIAHAMGLDDITTFGNPNICEGPLPNLS